MATVVVIDIGKEKVLKECIEKKKKKIDAKCNLHWHELSKV